jgi:putative aldouronate transport system substrate-binding protein
MAKRFVSVLVLVLAALLVVSCGNKKSGGTSNSAVSSGPFVITMLNNYSAAEPPPVDHEIFKMIEKETNAKFDITWVPGGGYSEKITLTLASNDMPMVINGKSDSRRPNIIEAQRAGIFWEITNALAQCPLTLNDLDQSISANLSVDGKLYALYQERPIAREAMIFRRDWLEKLNLPEPKNLKDLDTVVRAFASRDPDGNGKNDTYGILVYGDSFVSLLDWLCLANGGGNGWEETNGKFTPTFTTQPFIEILDLMRSWYRDRVINQDYVALKSVADIDDAFIVQRGGLRFPSSLDDALKLDGVYALEPNAKIDVLPTFWDNKGVEFARAGGGHSGGFFFPTKAIKDEAELVKILRVFDIINDPKGDIFPTMVWGLKDRHYTLDSQGRINQDQAQKELRNREINNFVQFRVRYDEWAYDPAKVLVSPLQGAIYDGWLHSATVGRNDPTIRLISDTFVDKGLQLENIRRDAINKYVMGAIDLNAYKAEIKRWMDTGGTKVVSEFEEQFQKSR